MNTRIKELADQAKNQVPKGILAPDLWIQEYNRIFAELIVRECADIAAINQYQYDSVGTYVLRHFGVE